MANLGSNVKTAFLKGLEVLGKTASSLTDAAQQKLSEMNLDTRRRSMLPYWKMESHLINATKLKFCCVGWKCCAVPGQRRFECGLPDQEAPPYA